WVRVPTAAATTTIRTRWFEAAIGSSPLTSTCRAARRPRSSFSTASSSCKTKSGAIRRSRAEPLFSGCSGRVGHNPTPQALRPPDAGAQTLELHDLAVVDEEVDR